MLSIVALRVLVREESSPVFASDASDAVANAVEEIRLKESHGVRAEEREKRRTDGTDHHRLKFSVGGFELDEDFLHSIDSLESFIGVRELREDGISQECLWEKLSELIESLH